MSLLALGLNHHTAPVDVRERIAFAPEQLGEALARLRGVDTVREAAIVSTCNRTEIYARLARNDHGALVEWLLNTHGLGHEQLAPYLFHHSDRDAVRHLLRVCAGLDSLVLGEPQILGQMKRAWQLADAEGVLGKQLNRLFQHAFNVAKKIRTDTAIGASPVSVAFAAVQLARQIFGELNRQCALMIGAGETAELALRHLHGQGVRELIIANRTLERAQALAAAYGATAVPLSELGQVIHRADVLIASTGSPLPVFGKGMVETAVRRRRHRPMLMIDIAVPRDIEPEVGELDDVFLYAVDDLQHIVDAGQRSRRRAADQAEQIVEHQCDEFMAWMRSLSGVDTLRAVRAEVAAQQRELADKALARLRTGDPPAQVVEQLARSLGNRFLDAPCRALREAAAGGDAALLEGARQLFGLDADRRR